MARVEQLAQHPRSRLGQIERRRRRFLDDLLVPPLDGALARAHRQRQAAVAEDLHLDVARPLEVPLEVHGVLPERGARPIRACPQSLQQLLLVARDLHPDPAAARRRLDQQRIPERRRGGLRAHFLADVPLGARHHRNARRPHHRARLRLVLDRAHRTRRRAHEHDARLRAGLGEVHQLGKKAVAGMDGACSRLPGSGEDFRSVEITFARRRRPQAHRLVARLDVERLRVRVGKDGDGLDTKCPGCSRHAAGDLAAVGDEDLFEQAVKPSVKGAQSTPEKAGRGALTGSTRAA